MSNQSLKIPTIPRLIKSHVHVNGNIHACVKEHENCLKCHSHIKIEVGSSHQFDGLYEYTPNEHVQEVEIKGYSAKENIIINPIPSNYGRIEFDGSTLSVI